MSDENVVKLDPFEPVEVAPGLAAIPLVPTPWDEFEDGQYAVTEDATVWKRQDGLWFRDPWWQGSDQQEILEICADPDEYHYNMGWTRKQIEETCGTLTPIELPEA